MTEIFEENTILAKMHEQSKSTKSESQILWNRHSKVHGPNNMDKITNRNYKFSLFESFQKTSEINKMYTLQM